MSGSPSIYQPDSQSEPFINSSAATSVRGTNGNTSASTRYSNGMSGSCLKTGGDEKQMDNFQLQQTIARLRNYLLALAVVCVIGFVILIAVVASLYVDLNYKLTHHNHQPKVGEQMAAILEREELCVPCDDFRLGPSQEETNMLKKFTIKEGTEGMSCCVDRPLELVELLKLYVERRFRQEVAKGTITQWPRASKETANDRKPAAHLMMAVQDLDGVTQIPGRQYIIGNWIHSDDLAFTHYTTYRHGRIVIPQDGFYYVYSQVSFMEAFDLHTNEGYGSRHSNDVPSLSHYLYRYNIQYHNGGEEKLAQNSITKCWGQSKTFGEYVSNLGAVFYLRNADEIFIKVSNITMVATDPKLSYFGLFKI